MENLIPIGHLGVCLISKFSAAIYPLEIRRLWWNCGVETEVPFRLHRLKVPGIIAGLL